MEEGRDVLLLGVLTKGAKEGAQWKGEDEG